MVGISFILKFIDFLLHRICFENLRLDNKEEKTKSSERELRRLENTEKVGPEFKKESRHKQHGDKRKTEVSVLYLKVINRIVMSFNFFYFRAIKRSKLVLPNAEFSLHVSD